MQSALQEGQSNGKMLAHLERKAEKYFVKRTAVTQASNEILHNIK